MSFFLLRMMIKTDKTCLFVSHFRKYFHRRSHNETVKGKRIEKEKNRGTKLYHCIVGDEDYEKEDQTGLRRHRYDPYP